MSGEHEHPEYAAVLAYKDYVEVKDAREVFPVDGEWRALPGLRPLVGSPFTAPDETQDLYVRLYPEFSKGGELSIEVRYMRGNGDATAYDEIQVTQQAASVPITRDHNEVGQKDVGGEWQVKLTGVGITAEVGTRYQKLRALNVTWV